MPAPLARGIIIAASVIVAASIAAYENPQFREWFDRSREKIAVAFQSTLDDIRPPRPQRDDPSMREDQDEKAAERRQQMRQEILERGKRLEALRQRRSKKQSSDSQPSLLDSDTNEKTSPSFDSLVDNDGKLRSNVTSTTASQNVAKSSAVEAQDQSGSVRPRHTEQTSQAPSQEASRDLSSSIVSHSTDFSLIAEPIDEMSSAQNNGNWESQYEREMRTTWNLPINSDRTPTASTHESESLLNLTPTTEDFPDPDYSIPSTSEAGEHVNPLERTEYFSIPPSPQTQRSQTAGRSTSSASSIAASVSGSERDYYYAHPSAPHQPVRRSATLSANGNSSAPRSTGPGSSAASVGDTDSISHFSDLGEQRFESSDDGFSEFGDGIRTPASAWTEVGSTISAEDHDEMR